MSDKKKKAIRVLMAQTGMKYCAAMRELERREAERQSGTVDMAAPAPAVKGGSAPSAGSPGAKTSP